MKYWVGLLADLLSQFGPADWAAVKMKSASSAALFCQTEM